MRLSSGHIICGDYDLRNWYAGELEPCECQMASSGCDHAPATLRNRAEEIDRARHHGDAVMIVRLAAFQLPHFRFCVEMRSDGANHFDRAGAVADGDYLLFVNPVLAGPSAPLPLHRARGVDQDSVEIEENGGAGEDGHSFSYCRGRQHARAGKTCGAGGIQGCQVGWLAELQMALAEVGL